VSIGFAEYIRIGLPVTIATLAFGTAWLLIAAS
jgi:Na+/H+ antiporter NhaD/arsenite permease-like protein